MPGRFEIQTQLPKLRRERPELNRVYSKVLQTALYHLCSNLVEVEESWKQVERLRFKGKGWSKASYSMEPEGFKMIKTGEVRFTPAFQDRQGSNEGSAYL